MIVNHYTKAVAVVPDDAVNLVRQSTADNLTTALFVGGAGVVAAVFQDGSVVNFTCTAGQILPIRIKRVNTTGTTATLMVALYQV